MGFNVHGLSFGEGLLWVADYHGHAVVRVDPALNAITGQPTEVGYSFEAISMGGGAVWTTPERFANDAVKGNDAVTRIDAHTLAVYDVLHAGGTPMDVKVGEGAVWVATMEPNALLRIEP
jgi:streptogramin lyase